MKVYGIRDLKTKQMFYAITTSNDGAEFCNAVSAELYPASDADIPWLTPRREDAEEVLKGEIEWFNSGMCKPELDRDAYPNVEIVEAELVLKGTKS